MKYFLLLIISILSLSSIKAGAAQISVGDSPTVNTGSLTNNDTILFTGSTVGMGTLNHNAARTLGNVSTNNSGIGTITINSSQGLTLGDVGSATNKIDRINFNAGPSGVVTINGSLYTTNGVTSNGVGGDISFNGSGINVVGAIGTDPNRLTKITVLSNSDAVFHDDLYSGTLDVNSNATATLNGSTNSFASMSLIGTLNIGTGRQVTLTTASSATSISGTLGIGVDDSRSGSAASVTSNYNVTVSNGASYNFDYSDASYLKLGDSYNFLTISNNGNLTVNGTQNVTDSSFLLAPQVTSATGSNGHLTVTQALDQTTYSSLYYKDRLIANFIINYDSPLLDVARTNLLAFGTQPEVEEALSTLEEDRSNMVQRTTFSMASAVDNIVSTHLQSVNYDQFATSSSKSDTSGNIWGEFFGASATQNNVKATDPNRNIRTQSEVKGYDATYSGAVLGFDGITRDGADSIFGAAFSYSKGNAKSQSLSEQKTDITSYNLSLYNYNTSKDGLGFFNENSIGGGYNEYDSSKIIKIGSYRSKSTANYSGIQYEAKMGFGYNFGIPGQVNFAPFAALKYFGLKLNDYKETNPDGLAMMVKNENLDLVMSEIGFRFMGSISQYVKPQINASWIHNLNTKGARSTSTFVNGAANQQKIQNAGVDLDADILNVAGQLNFAVTENFQIALKYDLQKSTNFVSHLGSVKLNFEF